MLKEILNKFLVLNGVQAAIVIQENGEFIESIKSGILIDDDLQYVLSTFMLDTKKIAVGYENSPISMAVLEFSDYFIILGPLMEEFYLVIIARVTANIGQITYEMKKHQDAIVSLL